MSVMVVDIWQMTPFTILILFAAMTGISEDWIEAAQVDGAKFWRIVRKIILPALMPILMFILLMRTMDLFKILTPSMCSPKAARAFRQRPCRCIPIRSAFPNTKWATRWRCLL